jgi:hypothetical protein
MPFLQPAITRIASGTTTGGVVGTDLYLTDANPDSSGSIINGNLVVNGTISTGQDITGNNLNAAVNVVAGNEVQAENVITTGLFSGDGTQNQIYVGTFPRGGVLFNEDQFGNTGLNVSRNYEVSPATARSYINCECVSGGTLYGYTGIAFQNNGTDVGTFGQLEAINTDSSIIGTIQINKQNGITLGNSTSATPTVSVVGSSGLGRVYDAVYNNPSTPFYSINLGATPQSATTPAGGGASGTAILSPAITVVPGKRYRVSMYGTIVCASDGTGRADVYLQGNGSADTIVFSQTPESTLAYPTQGTIEFVVPANNTTMNLYVIGLSFSVGGNTATATIKSLSVVQLD